MAVTLSDALTAQKIAEIDVQNAQIALARRTIRAPFAGVPGIADLSVGDLVGTTTKLVTLDDLSSILVDFEVPERWAGKIAIGQPISGTVSGYPGKAFAGRVSAIDSRVDATARTLRLQATLTNDQELAEARNGDHDRHGISGRGARFRSLAGLAMGSPRLLRLEARWRRRAPRCGERAAAAERGRDRPGRHSAEGRSGRGRRAAPA